MTPVRGIMTMDLPEFWPAMERLVADALEYDEGCYEPCDILDALKRQEMQAFMSEDGDCLMVTEIIRYPRKLVLSIVLVAGEMPPDWMDIRTALENWAAENGCDMVRFKGRPGWVRKMPDYRPGLIDMVKELRQ